MTMGGDNVPPMESEENVNDEMLDKEFSQENNIENDSEFNTNFDAGVSADEETDPKKYIQQLTGKLSQTLNSYNNEIGEPDIELGKYVLGMLIKQGTKGMDDKDRKEIIKKINLKNSTDSDEEIPENDDDIEGEMDIKTESKIIKYTKKQIFENLGIAIDDESKSLEQKEPDTKISDDTKRNRRTRPFEAPKKFKE